MLHFNIITIIFLNIDTVKQVFQGAKCFNCVFILKSIRTIAQKFIIATVIYCKELNLLNFERSCNLATNQPCFNCHSFPNLTKMVAGLDWNILAELWNIACHL